MTKKLNFQRTPIHTFARTYAMTHCYQKKKRNGVDVLSLSLSTHSTPVWVAVFRIGKLNLRLRVGICTYCNDPELKAAINHFLGSKLGRATHERYDGSRIIDVSCCFRLLVVFVLFVLLRLDDLLTERAGLQHSATGIWVKDSVASHRTVERVLRAPFLCFSRTILQAPFPSFPSTILQAHLNEMKTIKKSTR
jgi:hypothetical protein